jgi:tellurite resistance protein TehA-like permease
MLSTVGAVASVVIVLFGDVILAVLIIVGIMKIHNYFKNKKKNIQKK